MSVRSNGSGDQLTVAASLGLSTGNFSFAGWVRFAAFRDTANVLFAFTGGVGEVGIYSTTVPKATGAGTGISAEIDWTSPTPAVDTWYYLVLSRSGTGAGGFRLRIFDDSTSTTPLFDGTATMATDFTGLANYFVGETFAGEWADAEFVAHRVHIGVAWTDTQCRSESQNYDPVTGGGTIYGNWRLKTVNADADGINDSGGGAHHFTNTGFVNGASTPVQLAVGAPTVGRGMVGPFSVSLQQRY